MSTTSPSLEELAGFYPDLFRVAAQRHRSQPYDHVYFASLDAEWYQHHNKKNILISYQAAVCSQNGVAANNIYFVPEGKRPDLVEIIEKMIRSVNGGGIPESHQRKRTLVCIACHNTTAEFSILKDRDKPHIFEAINLVRNSPVTLTKPIELPIPSGYCMVDVLLFDTMLLAPATHRSLKKLSSLLGAESEMKETISQYHLENMNVFLEEDREAFIKYALKDTEATLKLFCLLQQSLNELAYNGEVRQLFITLANATMNSFIGEHDWHRAYLDQLNSARFATALQLVRRSYFGGRSEGLLRGRTSRYDSTRHKTWVDIDLCGCYPTAMSRIPRLDLEKPFTLHRTSYLLDDERVASLIKDNIPPDLVKEAQAALRISPSQFEQALWTRTKKGKYTSASRRIREGALVYDNTLIDRWYAAWQRAKQEPGSELERFLFPGFARVRFHFKEKPPLYPCLHVHHKRYGLDYTLKDETVATHMEIMLALDAGAQVDAIWSLELPMARDEEGQPILYTQQYLSRLAAERDKHKKEYERTKSPQASVYEKLLKEFMNSLYGKFAQGVNPRKVCDISTFEMIRLERSKITDPVVAALTTGTARAVLSSLLLAIERYNVGRPPRERIDVASCTTDGLLVGLPSQEGYSVMGDYYMLKEVKKYKIAEMRGKDEVDWSVESVLKKFHAGELLELAGDFLPVRLFRQAREGLTGQDEYLEIKGMADEVVAIKSRGQIGIIPTSTDDGVHECVTILAKFGVKPPLQEIEPDPEEYKFIFETDGVRRQVDGAYLLDHFDKTENGRDEIVTFNLYTLTTSGQIMKSDGQLDLVQQQSVRKLNCDFDHKRLPLLEEAVLFEGGPCYSPPYTLPFGSLREMTRHRHQADCIRKSGRVARAEEVIHRVKNRGKKTRVEGGEAAHAVRMFLRAVLQGHLSSVVSTLDYPEKAVILNDVWQELSPGLRGRRETWTVNDLKNNRRGEFERHCLRRTGTLVWLVEALCRRFGVNPREADSLLFTTDVEELNTALVIQVVKAVLHGRQLQPFKSLFLMGLLPGRSDLLRDLAPTLTHAMLDACEGGAFVPGERSHFERDLVEKLFRRLRIPARYARQCASVVVAPPEERPLKDRYAVSRTALENVVCWVLQPDFPGGRLPHSRVRSALRRCGLTDELFDALKRERFIPHRLAGSPKNRGDVSKLARLLRVDAASILAAVIGS